MLILLSNLPHSLPSKRFPWGLGSENSQRNGTFSVLVLGAKNDARARKRKEGEGKEGNVFLHSTLPSPALVFWFSPYFSRGQNPENPLPWSFFAPKSHGNPCYAGYLPPKFLSKWPTAVQLVRFTSSGQWYGIKHNTSCKFVLLHVPKTHLTYIFFEFPSLFSKNKWISEIQNHLVLDLTSHPALDSCPVKLER